MDRILVFIPFIVAIFGIAYPILFQVVSRLDEKYSSTLIIELFNKEWEQRLFKIFLILSLFSVGIYILKLSPLFDFGKFNFLVENSSKFLLGIATLLLIISFFLLVEKILIYNTPTRFLKYLMKKHNEIKDSNYSYLKAISEILFNSIKMQNETIAITISDYLYSIFRKERIPNENQLVEYPISLYETVHKATEELAILKSKKLAFLEYRTVGGQWLLGDAGNIKISERTFYWIWRNLLLAIKYERDDMLMYYWENAHLYYSMNLNKITPEHSQEDYQTVLNSKEIEARKAERKRFLEFQYALGGLLLYKKKYSVISRIFKYTTSIPPKYELLPDTMGDVFKMFIEFRDAYERKHYWISSKYQYPDIEGLNADYIIKNWITEYISLLFIRQYSIYPHLIIMKPLELPTLPKTQSEKKVWINNIDYFKTQVSNVLSNKELLSNTKLDFISTEWLKKQKKPNPLKLIDLYKTQVEKDYEKTKVEQKISKSKIEEFEISSQQVINKGFDLYKIINNNKRITKDYNNWFISGIRTVIDKSAFVDDQDAYYSEYDSFFADAVLDKIQRGISQTFYYSKSNSYLISDKEMFDAIDRLHITNKYIIISFRQNFNWLRKFRSAIVLTKDSYNGIDLINFQNCEYDLVAQSFFILKKSDLPSIIHLDIKKETIDKYSLKELDSETKLYGSIIDLNSSKMIQEELKPTNAEKDLRKSVLVTLSLRAEIRWKKDIPMTMIKMFSKYREQGLPNTLKDVKKLK